jgi:hypothetical protein
MDEETLIAFKPARKFIKAAEVDIVANEKSWVRANL